MKRGITISALAAAALWAAPALAEDAEPKSACSAAEIASFRIGDGYFASGKADVAPELRAKLGPLVELLKRCPGKRAKIVATEVPAETGPGTRVRIAGHTDSQGSDAVNLALSRRRADSVKGFLVGEGIEADRLEAVGFGEAQPVASNDTAEGRAKNRRVEFTVIAEDGAAAPRPAASVSAAPAVVAAAPAPAGDPLAAQAKEIKQIKQRLETLQSQVKEAQGGANFGVSWKEGLYFETKDKQFKANVGGRILLDAAFYEGDGKIEQTIKRDQTNTEVEWREVRLEVGGTAYQIAEYKAQIDFVERSADRSVAFTDRGLDLNNDGDFTDPGEYAPVTTTRTVTDSGRIQFKDVYLGLTGLTPFGAGHEFGLRVGHFKEPFSMETLTSGRFLTFMERGLPSVFAPSRNVGAQISSSHFEDRLSFAAGAFFETDDDGSVNTDGGKYNISARMASQPIWLDYDEFVHVGFGYSRRNPVNDSVRYRQRPESNPAERFVDTTALAAQEIDLFNPELAVVFGPFSAQGEYVYADVGRRRLRDAQFQGAYGFVSVFLTGESRGFGYKNGTFGRVIPNANFFGPNDFLAGPGAWEIAARVSHLNLNDDTLAQGGELNDITGGVNWYLNPNMRVMFNYIYANLVRSGEENIAQMRFQVDF